MISIIVPVYNAKKYIDRCLDSLINQSYTDIEIIIVDDGSTDASLSVCYEYQKKDNRIRIYTQENKGPVVARKRGVAESRGEYIAFVDSDDYVETNIYIRLLEAFSCSDVDFVHSGYYEGEKRRVIGSINGEYNFSTKFEREEFISQYVINVESSKCISPSMWSKLYKKAFIERIFSYIPENIHFGEDLLLLYISIMECKRAIFLNEAYYHYEENQNSITHKYGMKAISQIVDLHNGMLNLLKKYNAEQIVYEKMEEYIKWILSSYLMHMSKLKINRYILKNIDRYYGKKVVIYGAGQVGQDIYAQLSKYKSIQIEAWIDNNRNIKFDYCEIKGADIVTYIEYDYIIVAVKDYMLADEIVGELIKLGVDNSKIINKEIGIWI